MNIHEVAEAAGVSVATVSRVINHPEIVAEKTRERVLAVLKRTSYVPNAEPRAKRQRKKHAIALILPSLMEYPNVLAGVRAIAGMKNCGVQLCVTGYDEADAARNVRALVAQQVDGVILAADSGAETAGAKLREAGGPTVYIGGRRASDDETMCYINYLESAQKLAQYAVDTGNASALLLLDEQDSDVRQSLWEGFRQAWLAAGRPEEALARATCEPCVQGGYLAARDMLEDGAPALVVAQYDVMAAGVLKAAAERRVAVPRQLHVIGFHDGPVSTALQPELTSVEQPTYRLGIAAARWLFDILEDQEYFDIEAQEIVLKGRLRIRRSCGNRKTIYELFE